MKISVVYFCLLFFIVIETYGQSKIEKAEESLRKEMGSTRISTLKKSNSSRRTAYENNGIAEALGGFFVQILAYSVYAVVIESPFEMKYKGNGAYINKAPYRFIEKGSYSYNFNTNTTAFRVLFSAKYIFENSRLNGTYLNVNVRFLKRMGLEIDYLQLWENNPNFGSDNLAIYNALAKYYRVRTEKFDAWWGIGASYIDGSVNEFGFAYGLGAEWFFAKPLGIETNFNQTLINDNTINTFNGSLNYYVNRYKFTGGYKYIKVGDADFSTLSLGVGMFF